MKITIEQFNDFWKYNSSLLEIPNAERFHDNFVDYIKEHIEDEETIDEGTIDRYVHNVPQGKESTRKIIVAFYDYLNNRLNKGRPVSDLYDIHFYDNPVERQLEIAKYLHDPHSAEEIANQFGISERTVRDDIQALEEGITIFDATIKVRRIQSGHRKVFQSTIHPIFLPLNLTEVYAVTRYLDDILPKNDPLAETARGVIQRIVDQLSPYALEILNLQRTPDYSNHPGSLSNRYVPDDEYLKKKKNHIYMYLLKSGRECPLRWKEKIYVGKLKKSSEGLHIITNKGEVLDADLNDVEFLFDEIEYK